MTWLKQLLIAAFGLYAVLVFFLYLLQDRMIFFPRPVEREPRGPGANWSVEDLEVRAQDGASLRGWLVHPRTGRSALLIYFGGNAEEVSYLAALAHRYGGPALVLMNYRGYGRSEGAPTEANLFSDALAIYDAVVKRPDIERHRVILHGRSLGSGVATYLAAQRPVAGVILTSPFDSLTRLARRHYRLVPVKLLLRHPFDSLALAPSIRTPLLCLAATEDTVIPLQHSRRLFEAWGGPKRWHDFQAHHNNISEAAAYWDTISAFVRSL